jgi:hypothetical protein
VTSSKADRVLQAHAEALVEASEREVPRWVQRSVVRVASAYRGSADEDVRAAAAAAGRRAAAEVGRELRALFARDIDDQPTTPLTILRAAVRYPTDVLRRLEIPPVERDEQQARLFPGDDYDLAPANFADVSPELAEPGLLWGAAKAHVHLQRHRKGTGGHS